MTYDYKVKRFKHNSVFDLSLNPVPTNLRTCLSYISERFHRPCTNDLDIPAITSGTKIYGLMTNYAGNNFCWIQPSTIRSLVSDYEYDKYIRRINQVNRRRFEPEEIKVGMDCIVKYEADYNWYRGIVIKKLREEKWLVVFVDYGNFQSCDATQIAKPILEQEFNHYKAPAQAICCRIYNLVPTLPEYREDMDEHLKRFFKKRSQHFLEIVVRRIRSDHVVDCDIFLPKAKTDGPDRLYRRHIGQELVDAGLATFADLEAAKALRITKYKELEHIPEQMEFIEQRDTYPLETLVN